jgi:DNA-binding LytR/AlgR family response regulator
MKAPTAIIAEDEAPQRADLQRLLGELWPDLDILQVCVNGAEGLDAMRRHAPDIAFLDIRMPGGDGFEVARAAGPNTHVVFITAYDSFAVQAFEDGAADYLLKPVKRDRLQAAIDRVKGRLSSGAPADVDELLGKLEAKLGLGLGSGREKIRWITANVGGAIRMLPVDDVLFFQSQDKYTRVVTASEETHIRMPLKDLLPQLDADEFWQVHRGTVVRVSAIRTIKRDEDGKMRLHLNGKVETLPVSPAFAARFKGM